MLEHRLLNRAQLEVGEKRVGAFDDFVVVYSNRGKWSTRMRGEAPKVRRMDILDCT